MQTKKQLIERLENFCMKRPILSIFLILAIIIISISLSFYLAPRETRINITPVENKEPTKAPKPNEPTPQEEPTEEISESTDSLMVDTTQINAISQPPVISLTRENIKHNLLKNVNEIVNQTGLPEVKKIVSYLENNMVLAIPSGDTIKLLNPTIIKPLKLVIIMPGDSMTSLNWKKRASLDNAGINYYPLPNNYLVASGFPDINAMIQGIVLIHQGYKANIKTLSNYRNPIYDCQKEQQAHEIDNKILSILGGNFYARLLDKEVKRIKKEVDSLANLDSLKYQLGNFWPSRMKYSESNDLFAFFQAKTQIEKNIIAKLFRVHSVFSFLEKEFSKEEIQDKKIGFMHYIYYVK